MTLETDLKKLADLKASREDLDNQIADMEKIIKEKLNKWGIPFEKTVEKYIPYYPYTQPMYPNYPIVWCSTSSTNNPNSVSGYISYNG